LLELITLRCRHVRKNPYDAPWVKTRIIRLARSTGHRHNIVMNAAAVTLVAPAAEKVQPGALRLPMQVYASVIAVACLPLGILWDISWHISIGRDTFWAPAHIVMQLGGVIPALMFAWQAWRTTFYGTATERAASISFFGARASLGAWVTIWGALAMLTSAPFDDWWHNTYGLDVKIASPPHALLGLGMFAVMLGVLLYVLSWQNRVAGREQVRAAWLFTLSIGLMVTMISVYVTEFTWPNNQHTSRFYRVICSPFPFLFVMAARASRHRWAATFAAGTYTLILLFMVWVLPLFPAQPKLAPIYNPVDHMVPPPFPLLLIIPAFAVDCLAHWFGIKREVPASRLKRIVKNLIFVVCCAFVYFALALPLQWFFSKFLLSPSADNWFFAGQRVWPYYSQLSEWVYKFWDHEGELLTQRGGMIALLCALVSVRLGLWCGNWMLKVRR
jgi:hypothetical protein